MYLDAPWTAYLTPSRTLTDRSDLLGSPKKLPFSVAILLSISSAGHAETIIKEEFRCFHLETLERFDQLAYAHERVGDFMRDQLKSGECSGFLKIGTSVRVDKQTSEWRK
jgi:hypothetical protein